MPKSEYHVLVDPSADKKMFSHIRFLARVSVPAAKRLFQSLSKAVYSLKTNPERYPYYITQKPIDAELHYKVCDDRYLIIFEIIDNTVFVYDIQDTRQDIDKNLV